MLRLAHSPSARSCAGPGRARRPARRRSRGPRGSAASGSPPAPPAARCPSRSTAARGVLAGRPSTIPATTSRRHGDHLAVVLDEAELDVERDVLREVPHGVVRLGAEDRADLVDPLEDADQLLLVELRALGEVRRPAEVVDLEDVGAALGRRLDELGRLDLGEALARRGSRGSRAGWPRRAPTSRAGAGAARSSRRGRAASAARCRGVGRHSSTGGVSAGSLSAVTVGSVTSTPPGACAFGGRPCRSPRPASPPAARRCRPGARPGPARCGRGRPGR